ncbi:MAG: GUN4 domain-containing protein [Microcoleaceae cyanobacterium]
MNQDKQKFFLIFASLIVAVIPAFATANNREIFTQKSSALSQSQIPTPPASKDAEDSSAYTKLEKLLAAGKWQEADEETYNFILKVTRRDRAGGINTRVIKEKISCEEIRSIDQLWQKYSEEKFGLSIQKSIYLKTGNKLTAYEPQNYQLFGDRVGWRENRKWKKYQQLNFSEAAPKGHLPLALRESETTLNIPEFIITERLRRALYSKIEECGL